MAGRTVRIGVDSYYFLIIGYAFNHAVLLSASGVEEGTHSSWRVPKAQVAAGSGQNENQGPQGQGEGDERRTG